ncbi:hypothetical protein B0T20DRAFT_455507 [Sordaria brevicollis]|uniref:Uncharacterized protein n=1 Tax=Sordaria brevicollis TaxID=83679 RepID=A0AAE0P9H6_SORBR|nr:hypothetical protein B0T20DRAFT_455507 [Sordaria brevicollis]
MGLFRLPILRLFTFDTLSPLSRHTQTFAAHAPKAVLTSRDPALDPGRSNSFLIFAGSGGTWRDMAKKGAISGLDFFWTHWNWRGAMEYSLSNILTPQHMYGGHLLVGKPDEDVIPVATYSLNDTMSFPLYYLMIYDTLYERNFGLLSIMDSGRALDE